MVREYDAFPALLERYLAVVNAKQIIDVADPLLEQVINYGTWVLGRCLQQPGDYERDAEAAPLAILHRMLEVTDGIHTLVKSACGPAVAPLLRTLFDAFASLTYILQDRHEFLDRSRSWFVGHLFARIAERETSIRILDDFPRDEIPHGMREEAEEEVHRIKELLREDHLRALAQEYKQKIAKRRSTRVEWFSLGGGPRNRYELMKRIGYIREYEVYYSSWSRDVHANEFRHAFTHADDGSNSAAVYSLRNPGKLAGNAALAATFCAMGSIEILKWFRPNEPAAPRIEWYTTQVRPRSRRLHRLQRQFDQSRRRRRSG